MSCHHPDSRQKLFDQLGVRLWNISWDLFSPPIPLQHKVQVYCSVSHSLLGFDHSAAAAIGAWAMRQRSVVSGNHETPSTITTLTTTVQPYLTHIFSSCRQCCFGHCKDRWLCIMVDGVATSTSTNSTTIIQP